MPDAVIEGVNQLSEGEEQVEGIELLDMFSCTTINDMHKDLGPRKHGMLNDNYDDNYGDDKNEASDPDYEFNKTNHANEVKLDKKEYQASKRNDVNIKEELEDKSEADDVMSQDDTSSKENSDEASEANGSNDK